MEIANKILLILGLISMIIFAITEDIKFGIWAVISIAASNN